MTGKGTLENPYIVSTWSDFLTAAATPGAYVEFDSQAANKVINMDEIAPGGTDEYITVNAAYINGNGWTISNYYCSGQYGLYFHSDSQYGFVENLNFTKFRTTPNLSRFISIYCNTLKNCSFSGIIEGGAALGGIEGEFTANEEFGCSFDLVFTGGSFIHTLSGIPEFYFCAVNLSGTQDGNTYIYSNSGKFANCYISGEISHKLDFAGGSYDSILDAEIKEGCTLSIGDSSRSILVNIDKVDPNVFVPSAFTKVTEAELGNAERLRELRFPIGAE